MLGWEDFSTDFPFRTEDSRVSHSAHIASCGFLLILASFKKMLLRGGLSETLVLGYSSMSFLMRYFLQLTPGTELLVPRVTVYNHLRNSQT